MPKIGEFAWLKKESDEEMFVCGVVVSLDPLVLAQRLDFVGRDPSVTPNQYECQWDERAFDSEMIEFSGRMFVETKEEAFTHIDKYVREVIAPRME